jgi:hypothetical protein
MTVVTAVKVRIICFNRKSHLEGLYGRRGGIGTRRLVRFFFKVQFLFDPRQPLLEKSVEPRELLRQNGQARDEKNPTRHDGENEPYNAEEHKSKTGSTAQELVHTFHYVAKTSKDRAEPVPCIVLLVLFDYTEPEFSLTSVACLSKLRTTVTENRKNQRFELRLPFEVIRSGQRSQPIPGYTLNMSSNGVLFELTQPIALGEIIEYYITLPTGQDPEEDVRLRCMGKVVRNHENFSAATMDRYEFMRIRPGTVDLPITSGTAAS